MPSVKALLPVWMHPVPAWAWLLLALGLVALVRMLWLEIGVRARQIRLLRDERERAMQEFAEWTARWHERHAPGDDGQA